MKGDDVGKLAVLVGTYIALPHFHTQGLQIKKHYIYLLFEVSLVPSKLLQIKDKEH